MISTGNEVRDNIQRQTMAIPYCNTFDAELVLFREKQINTITAENEAHYVTGLSASMLHRGNYFKYMCHIDV